MISANEEVELAAEPEFPDEDPEEQEEEPPGGGGVCKAGGAGGRGFVRCQRPGWPFVTCDRARHL